MNGTMLSQLDRTASRFHDSENLIVMVDSEHLIPSTSSSMSSRIKAGSLYLVSVLANREFHPGNDGLSVDVH
jgi:hypothetical protein